MRLPESLNTIARRLANADLSHQEEEVRRAILRAFAAEGTSPTADDIIVRIQGLRAQEAARICRTLAEKDLIVWDDAEHRVQSAYPFSGIPTPHIVHLKGGPSVYALCAVDALGMPVMLGRAANIFSHCAHCNVSIEVAVLTNGLGRYLPRDSVMWFPMAEDVCCPVAESRCPDINFFCSEVHRDSWWRAKGQPEGLPLTMVEAFDVGREIFGSLLARPRSIGEWLARKEEIVAKQVIVYTQPGWGACNAEKEFLSQKGVEFTAKNIREDPQALEDLLKLGARATPVTVIDGEVIVGFDRGKIERLLGIS